MKGVISCGVVVNAVPYEAGFPGPGEFVWIFIDRLKNKTI